MDELLHAVSDCIAPPDKENVDKNALRFEVR
jgi:hypothetical protein